MRTFTTTFLISTGVSSWQPGKWAWPGAKTAKLPRRIRMPANGKPKHRSEWRNGVCSGKAIAWLPDGSVEKEYEFVSGDLKR